MQRIVSILFFTLALAPGMLRAQGANLLQHIWWQAAGDRISEFWGMGSLDSIGYADSSAQHAVAISDNYDQQYGASGPVISSYVLNRTPKDSLHPDTARVYEFPGQKIIRGDFNADGKSDFLCWNAAAKKITVLYGTDTINKFDTALVLQGDAMYSEFEYCSIVVANFDSTRYQGFVINDYGYEDSLGNRGRMLYYRGNSETKIDPMPIQYVYGDSGTLIKQIGSSLAIGNILNNESQYLVAYREHWDSAFYAVLYPLGPMFNLSKPSDTVILIDQNDRTLGTIICSDVFGTGVDAIVIGSSPHTLIYGGLGGTIPENPTFKFSSPDSASGDAFGTALCDAGDVTGKGFHSLAISDVDVGAGKVYLFNLQKALKDSVTASAEGNHGGFGTTIITPGDVANIGRNAIMIGGDAELNNEGRVVCLLGDTGWAPPAAVNEPQLTPIGLTLMQNYPNPFNGKTDISFSVDDSKHINSDVTLNIYDMLGREIFTAYRGKAESGEIMIRLNVAGLPAGNYFYRLSGGGEEVTKMMCIMK